MAWRYLSVRRWQRSVLVPEAVLERLIERWEVPDVCEAHQVVYAVRE